LKFKRLADQKKDIYDEDLEAIVSTETEKTPEVFRLLEMNVTSGTDKEPTASVRMEVRGSAVSLTGNGDGPVDATYRAIAELTGARSELLKFEVKSITEGMDALGEVIVSLEEDGVNVRGHGADTDILVASAKAYINALNRLEAAKEQQ
jgi:2-isopropylmalate synthase